MIHESAYSFATYQNNIVPQHLPSRESQANPLHPRTLSLTECDLSLAKQMFLLANHILHEQDIIL